MIRKAFIVGIGGGLMALAACPKASAAELRSMQLSVTADSAVLTLALTSGPAPRIFTLDGPDRAVIDLPGTQAAHRMALPPPAGIVSAVRVGRQPDDTLRIVLELRSAVAVRSSQAAGASGERQLTVALGDPAAAPEPAPKAVRPAHEP